MINLTNMINETTKQQVVKQGMSLEKVEEQIKYFEEGFPFLPITEAARIGHGIKLISPEELENYQKTYPDKAAQKDIVKFVPASGAATRMFKDLYAYLNAENKDIDKHPFVKNFISNIKSFAFYRDLVNVMKEKDLDLEEALEKGAYPIIICHLLNEEGLGYGNLPKGLIKFHHYNDGSRTPVYEHFIEGVQYGIGKNKTVKLHFTVSPEHQEKFEEKINFLKESLEKKHKVKFEVSYSQQKKSTDTIAVNMDNTPFIEKNGEILFRPAGHGALLENLNDIDADLIFIKNIDNVVPDRLKETTKKYKIAIASILLEIQQEVFQLLHDLDEEITEERLDQGIKLLEGKLGFMITPNYPTFTLGEKAKYIKKKLNRPIRVCGMVENTGEPGGGPFWVREKDGSQSLQIGETAQLNLEDPQHQSILKNSSHFNPTDLVCGVRDYEGNKFDLLKFRDPNTGFISKKSKDGKDLKALELPGLWNGSMANWNTIFVEVPLITFNPVKTINDLLREQHQ
ncbi:DUF4301 family protein [Echinicola jeungdonensis]|uniref:DUF4301 family protein n=1 Tax=Echinicola jeungdonensis TaxID=709343 RepID=A0ABV5J0D1_9BACT|nr:DUF4301 family protein [Echinicola jeungdonensis]MDN3671112.1 DUF4301 family protein [Echinicola jeungdonensis]